MDIIMIISAIVAILGTILIIYIHNYNKIQELLIRIKESEGIINESLRDKYDVITKIIKIIKSNAKIEQDYFKKFEKSKNQNISNFDFDRILKETETLIENISGDYSNIIKKESFILNNKELKDINNRLMAAKLYYNKNTSIINSVIKKIPSNLIAKINKIKLLAFFDGIDLYDEDIKDFKL